MSSSNTLPSNTLPSSTLPSSTLPSNTLPSSTLPSNTLSKPNIECNLIPARIGSILKALMPHSPHIPTDLRTQKPNDKDIDFDVDIQLLIQNKCRPYDKGDYKRRVSSFLVTDWFAKPSCMSPLSCARYGWVNVGPETVECSLCQKRLVYTYTLKNAPPDSLGLLTSSHADSCSWKDNSCPASFETLPLFSLEQLKEWILNWVAHPQLDQNFLKDFEVLFHNQIGEILSMVELADNTENRERCILSVTGWNYTAHSDPIRVLSCSLCQRTLPFEPKQETSINSNLPESKPNKVGEKRRRDDMENGFHCFSEHRYYCPWRKTDDIAQQLNTLLTVSPTKWHQLPEFYSQDTQSTSNNLIKAVQDTFKRVQALAEPNGLSTDLLQ